MSTDPISAGARMDCGELQRSLDAFLDGEFHQRERDEVSRHLEGCPACQHLVDRESRARGLLRARLREAMGPGTPAGTAPGELRQRIRASLARERRPWRLVLSPVPLAAVAACAAGALVVLWSHGGSDPLIEEAVRKHARDLPLEMNAAAMAPEAIPGMLASMLDFNARPPHFQAQGLRLVGARLSHLRDRPAAYMRYELPQGQVGLFILDDPDRSIGESGRTVQLGPGTVRVMNSRGYNVAVWRRNEIVYSLVSDLDERDLVRLVETAQAAAER
jgi:anti-sigma factor (TIGR02949 family)